MADRALLDRPAVDLLIRPSLLADADDLADRLRPEDRDEIKAHSGSRPLESLLYGIAVSDPCMTVCYKGRPEIIFGVVPLRGILEETGFHQWPAGTPLLDGAVWLLGSPEIHLFSRPFLRYSKAWLEEATQSYRIVGNIVDIRNQVHVRWIKWLGFKLLDRIEYGPENRKFIRFVKEIR